jgi:hypothetical protein
MKNNSQKYLANVKKLFQLTNKSERAYLNDLKRRVYDYAEDFPEAVYVDYIDHFGDPKDNLISFYEHTDINKLIKYISFRKLFVLILTIITIISIFISITVYTSFEEGKNSYIDREEIEIVEE